MTAEEVIRAWFDRVWTQRDVRAIAELCEPGVIGHLRPCDIVGAEAFEQLWHAFFGGLPDMSIELEDVVAKEDRAVARWRVRGTHTGDGLGFAPTGKRIEFTGMTMLRVQNGKIVEGWDEWDYGGLVAKLGGQ